MTFHQHLVDIFICIPFTALMNTVSTFSQNHCSHTIILCYNNISLLAQTDQFKIYSIGSCSHCDHFTVI